MNDTTDKLKKLCVASKDATIGRVLALKDPQDIKEAGFKAFNSGTHLCLEIERSGDFTISVNMPHGKQVSFAFLPSHNTGLNDFECIDIHLQHSGLTMLGGSNKPQPLHKLVVFRPGDPACCRVRAEGTMATLLVADSHYIADKETSK